MLTTIDFSSDALAAAAQTLETAGPVCMVNLLRFRDRAEYDDHRDEPLQAGREVYYQRYAAAFRSVAQKVAPGETFSIFMLGSVHATLVAPAGETWDAIVIVEYPSFEALRRIIGSREYEAEAAPHRRAALADWRFIATTKDAPPS